MLPNNPRIGVIMLMEMCSVQCQPTPQNLKMTLLANLLVSECHTVLQGKSGHFTDYDFLLICMNELENTDSMRQTEDCFGFR